MTSPIGFAVRHADAEWIPHAYQAPLHAYLEPARAVLARYRNYHLAEARLQTNAVIFPDGHERSGPGQKGEAIRTVLGSTKRFFLQSQHPSTTRDQASLFSCEAAKRLRRLPKQKSGNQTRLHVPPQQNYRMPGTVHPTRAPEEYIEMQQIYFTSGAICHYGGT